MSSNIPNNVPYLRTSRTFPVEVVNLALEMNKAYIDIANSVNNRTISVFTTNFSVVTGESWFFNKNKKQQTLRQFYTFIAAGNIPHNIDFSKIAGFTRIYGTFTDGTNWYPLPYVDVISATNQVNVIVTPMNIVITSGGGAPPAIQSGFVVLEYLSEV